MKRILIFTLTVFCWIFAFGQAGKLNVETAYLNNGMKVLLCEDHSKSEIYGAVCVHAGSKNDPADATGMAHYLEHIMFKGTNKIGTIDWASEKPLIDQISKLYDELAATKNDKEKKAILKNINKLSLQAAQYAIPNELDALLAQIGSTDVNAFTSEDNTVYLNAFPSGELEKWSVIYAERFRQPVFRLFQSELEAVYEEYNMYSDDAFSVFQEDIMAAAFPGHPYGNPIIGKPEHIKNPSMSKMYEFFRTYYVPKNMTMILVGDFNPQQALKILNDTWCQDVTTNPKGGKVYFTPENDKKKDLSNPDNFTKKSDRQVAGKKLPTVSKFQGKQVITMAQTPIKTGAICYQTVPSKNKDAILLELCSRIMSNGASTGLLDHLCNEDQLYTAWCYDYTFGEAGLFTIHYYPKTENQTHEQAEELVDQCINKLKQGNFSDQLFDAVKMNYLKEKLRDLEDPYSKFINVVYLDFNNQTIADYEKNLEMVKNLQKKDLVAIANKYFGENVLVYRSEVGRKKMPSIEKPDWKPIPAQNTDLHSDFAQSLDRYNSYPSKIQKIDFDKDVAIVPITNAFDMYIAHNPCNDIFTLNFIYDYGTVNDPILEYAIRYFDLQGTEKKTFDEFNLALQSLGASLDVFVTTDNTLNISISGFEKDFAQIIALCAEKLNNPGNDEQKLSILIEDHINSLKTMKENSSQMGEAVYDYAVYGQNSPYLMMPSTLKVKNLKGQELLDKIHQAMLKSGHTTFVGNIERSTVVKTINQYFQLASTSKKHPEMKFEAISAKEAGNPNKNLKVRPVLSYNTSEVYVLHSTKFLQSNIYFYIPGKMIDETNKAKSLLFNEYYDGSNSIIYQNIRELRSLGYATYGFFSYDHLNRRNSYTTAFLGTQSDKTIDGIKAMSELLKTFLLQPDKFAAAKLALVKQYEADHIEFRAIPEQVYQWKLEGYEKDPRQSITEMLVHFNPNQIQDFFNANIAKRPMVITIAGNMNRINKKQLSKFGKVTFLEFNDVLNN